MILIRCIFFYFFYLTATNIAAQQHANMFDKYIYTTYTEVNGLKGDIIYSIAQDSTGYIWIATNAGLNRFDGKYFKHYTTKDGLPNNEILKLFVDSKNRVWMSCLKPVVCYYYNGIIHTINDDSHLIADGIFAFGEDKTSKNIIFCSIKNLYIYGTKIQKISNDTIRIIGIQNSFKNKSATNFDRPTAFFENAFSNSFKILVNTHYYYDFYDGKLVNTNFEIKYHKDNTADLFYKNVFYKNISRSGNTEINTTGADFHNSNLHFFAKKDMVIEQLPNATIIDSLFKGNTMNAILEDKERSYWAGGANTGLIKLANKAMRNIHTPNYTGSIYALNNNSNNLQLGAAQSTLFNVNTNSNDVFNLHLIKQSTTDSNITQRPNTVIRKILPISPTKNICLTDGGVFITQSNTIVKENVDFRGLKSICRYGNNYIIASKFGVYLLNSNLQVVDTFFTGRTVSLAEHNDSIWVGTPIGLHCIQLATKKIVHTYLPNIQVNDIAFALGNTFAATEEGLYTIQPNQVQPVSILNDALETKNVHCFFVKDQALWIGTDNGVYKLTNFTQQQANMVHYSVADGLLSNKINALFVTDSLVYVATNIGACYFKERDINKFSICNLQFTSASINKVPFTITGDTSFAANARNIDIQFVAVAPKSNGSVTYYYKLDGFDAEWHTTNNPNLIYAKLPSGTYTLRIYAINSFGLKSNELIWTFTIKKYFWQTWWFIGLCILCIMGIWYAIQKYRLRKAADKAATLQRLQTLIAESEQKALRAQMNPHFIYNCLNSIQQFFVTNDVVQGNKYLTNFASLLRQTLQNSEQVYITLQQECKYISTYLDLELLRFKNKFTYSVEVDKLIDTEKILIPSMILQPFIENALRHGILHKPTGVGQIDVIFTKLNNDTYRCSIKDNGIGRKASEAQHEASNTKHESKGILITKNRLDVINMQSVEKTALDIVDVVDAEGNIKGTEIIIDLPFNIQDIKQHNG